jgi:hypothetical protein
VLNNPTNYIDPYGLEMALSDSDDVRRILGLPGRNFQIQLTTLLMSFLPLSPGGFGMGIRGSTAECATASRSNLPSTLRRTGQGEAFIRYESGHSKYTRVTPEGGLLPGTYAAPSSDGILQNTRLSSQYNLPDPQIPRTLYYEIKPPAGTWVEGPRPVIGGGGNEVIFPYGTSSGSVSFPTLVP